MRRRCFTAWERNIEVVQFSLVRYYIAFVRNDRAAMEREVTERRRKREAQGCFEHQEALTLAYHGRLKEADRLSARAISLARQGGLTGRAACFRGRRRCGMRCSGARRSTKKRDGGVIAFPRPGCRLWTCPWPLCFWAIPRKPEDRGGPEALYPQDTSVQFSYLPVLRSLEALNQDDPARALEITHTSAPYDLAVPGTAYFTAASFFGALYPVYVRVSLIPSWAARARPHLSFEKFSIIRDLC